ncbi:secretion protein HlyD [Pollutimonas bauzanensis]|uniref:HlyD family secretion protein n=1 Tax=Pollutimonas bauzanensis TaxID=658167 RepID=A0A1M6A8A1_9BURK|nr:secretion protein HlyD [Pollutimonas bauzanensis]SHI32764.1 HlyD family secretion protein [Pollutimonas bauzanensis]
MSKKQAVIGLAIALALAAGGYIWYSERPRDTELVLSGNIDIREVNLAFRVGGRLKSLAVDEGDTVQAGQILAELDTEPLRNALAEAQAAVQAVSAKNALMQAGYRKEDVARLHAALQARSAVLRNAEQVWARQRKLAGTGAIAVRVLDESRAARDKAAAEFEASRQEYEAASLGFRKEERDQASADLALARVRLASARLQLDDATLKAPVSGVVLTRAAEAGAMVQAGATVFALSLGSPVWARAYVDEPNLGRVATGTKVRISTDGASGKIYEGVVGFVSPVAEFTPKQVETQDLRTALVYRLRVIVANPDSGLRQGMPVTVRLAQDAEHH